MVIMKPHTTHYIFVVVAYAILTLSFATENLEKSDTETENADRNRRDLSDFEQIEPEEVKRQREFIGKRFRDFLGKRSNDDQSYDLDASFPETDAEFSEQEKRMRDFVGKRFSDDDLDYEKRMRDFVGKRTYDLDDMEKRQREFVGKRTTNPISLNDDDTYYTYDKRMRDFVGKRYDDASYLVKRLREFVGKRFTPEDIFRMRRRHRLFIQKPKYERELIGKRSDPSDSTEFEADKRMRDFVGKRMRDFVGKRTREFIGK